RKPVASEPVERKPVASEPVERKPVASEPAPSDPPAMVIVAGPTITPLAPEADTKVTTAEISAVPVLTAAPAAVPVSQVRKVAAQPPQSAEKPKFILHLSCFLLNSTHATRLQEKMTATGLPFYRKTIQNGEHSFDCGFAGPFVEQQEAEAAIERIKKEVGLENPLLKRYLRY
ncbi:MAG: hypothetical protein HQM02_11915, partial [Magnetococcales bacterium]|nr:hypothetical protein [Magnetococcales bacterium]